MNKGFLWTAYGINHEPLQGYQTLFAFNRDDATKRFKREYGNDSSILYLIADTFNQWEE
jgi:nicotinic acid phosphoribosyltransferase|tara:strand:- start:562 stop:738 length:177 start_codon:yes stop_codon:yes gene_type:complete